MKNYARDAHPINLSDLRKSEKTNSIEGYCKDLIQRLDYEFGNLTDGYKYKEEQIKIYKVNFFNADQQGDGEDKEKFLLHK